MNRKAQALAVGGLFLFLGGCTHVPAKVKSASARQTELLAALDRSLADQDLAKGCGESFKAAAEMEEVLKKRGAEIQDRVKKNYTEAIVRAQAFKEKPELAAKKEAEAMQAFIEQTTALQANLAKQRAEIDVEKSKCAEAVGSVRDMVRSLARAQVDLDKFVQSDAKSPIEAFVFSLVETQVISKKVDEAAKKLQAKMGSAAERLNMLENAINPSKE